MLKKLSFIGLFLLGATIAGATIQPQHIAVLARKNAGGGVTEGVIGSASYTTSSTVNDPNDPVWSAWTTTTAGTINTVSVWLNNCSGDYNVIITDSSGNKLVDGSLQSVTNNTENSFTLDSDLEISASTSYRIGIGSKTDSSWSFRLNGSAGAETNVDSSHDVEDSMDSTLDDSWTLSNDKKLAIRGHYV